MKASFKVTLLASLATEVLSVAQWGQCGGIGYGGDTNCDADLVCTSINSYYSQCLAGSGGSVATPPTVPETGRGTTNAIADDGLAGKMIAKGKKYFGTAADPSTISNQRNANILKSQFNQLTPENSMKWDTVEASQGNFNFSRGGTLVDFAQTNGHIVRGHTLVWHSQLPSWVSSIRDSATLTSVIENHIAQVAGRWAGKIYGWDVLNEILREDGDIRVSVFSNVLGEDFVSIAFNAARHVDPKAVLYINDYNLDSASYGKTIGMVNRVKKWKAAGVPIDGIGSQVHLAREQSDNVLGALSALAGTGVTEVAITELDIIGASANDYSTVTKACLAVSICVGITVSGVSDTERPGIHLYDHNYQPKAAYYAVIEALS